MASEPTEREILERKLERRLQDPETEPLICLPLHFLEYITSGFSTELGRGGCGAVYKGVLRSGKTIAVKKIFDNLLLDNDDQVVNEIICLTEVRHQNVVQLVGYCVETKSEVVQHSGKLFMAEKRACLLCFEFLRNGSLEKYLSDDTSGLDWDTRYEIIRGVCRGLHYLHDKCHIVHLDLKPQNILMDATMMPKIADFGLSRILGQKSNSIGTLGYRSREYIDKGIISYKADIFSLGVIIIEIITGHKDYPSIGYGIAETSLKHYIDKVVGSWRNRTPMHMPPEMHIQQVEKCISIALKCLKPESNERLTSLEIVQDLNALEPESGSPGNSPSDPEKDIPITSWTDTARKSPVTVWLGPMAPLLRKVRLLKFFVHKHIQGVSDDNIKHFNKHLEVLCSDLLEPEETSSLPNWWRKEVRELLYDTEDQLDKVILLPGGDFTKLIADLEDACQRRKRLNLPPNDNTIKPDLGDLRVTPKESTSHKLSMPISAGSSCIVGVDTLMDKLVKQLAFDDDTEDRLDKVNLLSDGYFSDSVDDVEDAGERRKRLKLAPNDKTIISDLGKLHVSSCLITDESTSHKMSMPISSSKSCIVGVGELMDRLVKQLAFDDHNQKVLKVVPILGFPGVGKTTAAGTLYHQHRGKFQCSAFVRVSRTPDMRSLLINILLQIKAPLLQDFPDVLSLIDGIGKHLKGKRYFIVLDGLWTASVWDIIRRAFPDGNYGSRIVTTTQIYDVALACCRYYPDYIEMSPLNDDQSRRLFSTVVFGSEDRCPSDFKEVSYKIIKKCGGIPLAIVSVASLLRRESNIAVEKWEHIQDSLPSISWTNPTTNEAMSDLSSDSFEGSHLARGTEIEKWKHIQDSFCSTFEGLKQVIGFIYNNLPPHLKTCLLYLSMYPEASVVRKHDLVRQWVAEGFVNDMGGRSAEEIAGDYFDDIVRSGIVQPVVTKYGSEVLSCTVHHMVLDHFRHKSKEMNFIITVDYLQSWLALADQVRRLSIQFGGAKSADLPEDIEISKLRSLLFCGFIDCVPSVLDYEFLRVLILDIWSDGDETKFDLTRISKLLQLRYLKVQSNLMVNLPTEISGLKFLETLELDARVSDVPSDIGRSEKLLHLLLPNEAILPRGYGSLTSLLTLGCFDLSKNSSQNVIDIAKLTNLQDLRLTCSTSTVLTDLVGNIKQLRLILGKLNNLRSLALHGDGGASSQWIWDDALISVSPPPALLEKLELRPRICTLSRIPKWIGELSRLAILKIEVVELSNVDIATLELLASLTALSLSVLDEHVEQRIVFKKGFPALKYFKFVRTAPYMFLSEGAMPNVQKLKLAFNANRILKPGYHPGTFGFEHMTSLTEVTIKFGGAIVDESTKGEAERVIKDAFSNNPGSPIVNIQWAFFEGAIVDESTKGEAERVIKDAFSNNPGSPIVNIQWDRRQYKNLYSHVNMNVISIPNTIGVISGLNEFANLFQWVRSAISSLKSQYNGIQKEILQEDILQLHSDLQCLTETLPTIHNLIDRAEWRIHDTCVANLLPSVKDAVSDAEDLLDEFRWYETKVSAEGTNESVEPIIEFFYRVIQGSFNTVTDIQKRLNNLSGQLEKVGLLQAIPRFEKSLRPETTSFPTEAKIFGRDKEKKKLIRWLGVPTKNSTDPSGLKRKRTGVCSSTGSQVCATNDSNEATIPSAQVLPIVGIGGVGKTTLAQEIYNNSEVQEHFDLIIWICVSDDFDVKRLTKEAIEQSCENVPKNDNLNFLQGALANSLNTRRFLLVLDDMWNENQQDWKRFCAPFRNVLQGSMILVTTRSQKVADVVGTMDPFPLEGLKEDAFRKFFKQCVFGSDRLSNYPELEQIGEKILPKLKGSPLAAKTLGRLLGMSLELGHWEKILESQLWELTQEETEILPALRLSYMYLPFHLKRCFSFCAVYPKDHRFEKEDLAEIWEAQGLVGPQHTGDQYFEELAQWSFFQKYPRSQKYVIHDLIHDMAQLVSKGECFIVKDTEDISKIPQNVRHLLVLEGGDVRCEDLLNLCKHKKLRTLHCDLSLESETGTGNIVMEKWCAELMHMRVMVCSSISQWGLPGSISNMKHLRYLKILDSCAYKSLPADFCRLYSMQFFCAKQWEIDEIPSGFGMLINLQKFESKGRQFHRTHSGRKTIFQNLPNITSLGVDHRKNVDSMSFQSHNSTMVEIEDCQDLSSVEQFLQPAYVPNIKEIRISGCKNLESVLTEKFGDLRFIQAMNVYKCPKIKSQRLFAPSLKELYLSDSGDLIDNIDCSSLTKLVIEENPTESIELKMWNLPSLQELEIRYCHSLTIIRDSEAFSADLFHSGATTRMGKFPLLTCLSIRFCQELKTMDDLLCLPAIERIYITQCDGLESLPANRLGDSSRLKFLRIWNCSSLKGQSALLLPPSLQNLQLWNCRDFSGSFPTCLENLTCLEELGIVNCECIVSVPGHLWRSNLKSLKRLELRNCAKLKSIGGPEAIGHMKDLIIDKCPELKEIEQPLRKG